MCVFRSCWRMPTQNVAIFFLFRQLDFFFSFLWNSCILLYCVIFYESYSWYYAIKKKFFFLSLFWILFNTPPSRSLFIQCHLMNSCYRKFIKVHMEEEEKKKSLEMIRKKFFHSSFSESFDNFGIFFLRELFCDLKMLNHFKRCNFHAGRFIWKFSERHIL